MKTKTFLAAAAATTLALSIASCSGDSPSTPAENADTNVVQSAESPQSEEEAEEGPTEAELMAYFEALGSEDPKIIREAVEMAAPGSNAEAYAIYYAAARQAGRDAGYPTESTAVKRTEGGFSLCPELETGEDECFDYTNIQHEGDQIADFYVGDDPLAGRLSLGSGEAQPLGELGEATMIAAYRSVGGYVVTVLEIKSSSEGLWPIATYLAPDSRQSDVTLMDGPVDLSSGALANYAFYFEGAEFGGEVLIEAIDELGQSSGSVSFQTQ